MTAESTATAARPTDEPNTALNALVGAVVTVVAAPLLPFSAIVGGAVSGYLQGEDLRAGATVGAGAGAIAFVPAFLLAWFVVGVMLMGTAPMGAAPMGGVFVVVAFVVVAGYLVGAGALGGALGAYLRREL